MSNMAAITGVGAVGPGFADVLGRTRPYYQLERLSNLDQLPQEGFLVVAVPVLVGEATAAWSRIFALVPRSIPQH